MSQIYFETSEYNVLTGWDRPLQYYFLIIEDKNGYELYSNLNEKEPSLTLYNVRDTLISFGICGFKNHMEKLLNLLVEHRKNNIGNLIVKLTF